ncbi:hypothetical protein HanRHA438_Chr01g0015461 [Helianthus annuus]|nr:hypothetical protein HanRHA438_Chr01g0015461 [Helianthus annuus]
MLTLSCQILLTILMVKKPMESPLKQFDDFVESSQLLHPLIPSISSKASPLHLSRT